RRRSNSTGSFCRSVCSSSRRRRSSAARRCIESTSRAVTSPSLLGLIGALLAGAEGLTGAGCLTGALLTGALLAGALLTGALLAGSAQHALVGSQLGSVAAVE